MELSLLVLLLFSKIINPFKYSCSLMSIEILRNRLIDWLNIFVVTILWFFPYLEIIQNYTYQLVRLYGLILIFLIVIHLYIFMYKLNILWMKMIWIANVQVFFQSKDLYSAHISTEEKLGETKLPNFFLYFKNRRSKKTTNSN